MSKQPESNSGAVQAAAIGLKAFLVAMVLQGTVCLTGGCFTGLPGLSILVILSVPSILFLEVIGVELKHGEFEVFRQLPYFLPLNALWIGLIAFFIVLGRNAYRSAR